MQGLGGYTQGVCACSRIGRRGSVVCVHCSHSWVRLSSSWVGTCRHDLLEVYTHWKCSSRLRLLEVYVNDGGVHIGMDSCEGVCRVVIVNSAEGAYT